MTHLPVLLAVLGLLLGGQARALSKPHLTLSAAISLKPLLDQFLPAYRASSGWDVVVDYGASGLLARRIMLGAPVDLFLSAGPEYVDLLVSHKKALPHSRRTLAEGSLVLIAPKAKTRPQGFSDLTQAEIRRVAVGDPQSVPLGRYTMEIFQRLKMGDQISPKLIKAVDARQVLRYVEWGEVDGGVVYLSDALGSDRVRLVEKVPPLWHTPILYEGVVLAGSSRKPEASTLLQALTTGDFYALGESLGFKRPSP